MGLKPTDFPTPPGGITDETELYTQRRTAAEQPSNYRFTVADLRDHIFQKDIHIEEVREVYNTGKVITLPHAIVSENHALVSMNGQILVKDRDYTVDAGAGTVTLLFGGDGTELSDFFQIQYEYVS
jgi:hypothetical protein